MTQIFQHATAGSNEQKDKGALKKMNCILYLVGITYAAALVAQMLACAESTNKAKVELKKTTHEPNFSNSVEVITT